MCSEPSVYSTIDQELGSFKFDDETLQKRPPARVEAQKYDNIVRSLPVELQVISWSI